jgi:hypothetical protein
MSRVLRTMVATAVVGEAPNVGDRWWPGELGFVLFSELKQRG